mmetsp:Transcript_11050/g.46078  ORF Transcript_11050/g.46078 Transcript_11050/m.46078 type:complete len:91 (-) Transcript_11050:2212-2484(-)
METAGKPRESSQKQLAKVVFELFMGAAECAWEKGDTESAFVLVENAAKKIDDLPEEIDFLARYWITSSIFQSRSVPDRNPFAKVSNTTLQ